MCLRERERNCEILKCIEMDDKKIADNYFNVITDNQ